MKLSSIIEIRYLRFKRQLLLLELMELINGIKPGVFIELTTKDYDYTKIINTLKNFVKKTNLYLSLKNNGYITNNKRLLKDWEENNDKYINANKFIGYPECCNKTFNKLLENKKLFREIYWYYIIKTQSIKDIINYVKIISYVSHYPCSFSCKKTIKLSNKIKKVIKENKELFNPSFEKKLYYKKLSSIRKRLRNIIKAIQNNSFIQILKSPENTQKLLKDKKLITSLKIRKDFKKKIKELFSKDIKIKKKIIKELNNKIEELKVNYSLTY